MATVDITVYGAGAFGLAVAYGCASRGAKVRVIDPAGVTGGASGGLVGALAPHVPERWNDKKSFQLESLLMAQDFWDAVEALAGQSAGYLRSGRLQPLADQAAVDLARARTAEADTLWQGKAKWSVVPASDHQGWAPPSASGWLVHDTLTARATPRSAVRALARAVQALGGEIVTEGDPEGRIVHATGWRGLIDLSDKMGKLIGNGVKGQSALLKFSAPDKPQLFSNGIHIVPHEDGTVAIGSTSERYFDDPTSCDELLEGVIDRARIAFPMLADAPVVERWAGVRPRAKNRSPILGDHPLYPGEFIANGGFKIGFGMAPKVGTVMADLILDGINTIPPGFRPEANF